MAIPISLTLTNVDLERKLIFQADSGQIGHVVDSDSEIRGTLKEFLTSASQKHLNREVTGRFTLLKQIARIEP